MGEGTAVAKRGIWTCRKGEPLFEVCCEFPFDENGGVGSHIVCPKCGTTSVCTERGPARPVPVPKLRAP